jgi:hypothetical protein
LSIDDSTSEAVLQRMIEAKRRFIRDVDQEQGIRISSVTKSHFQLQIKTLQKAPRDAAKLEQMIRAKEREDDQARHFDDTQRLVTEIEMLKWYCI